MRRINGKELTDDEMREHYAELAAKHGGRITGRYRNAIYFILDEEHHYSSMDIVNCYGAIYPSNGTTSKESRRISAGFVIR